MSLVVDSAPARRAFLFLAAAFAAGSGSGCIKGDVGDLPIVPITHPDLNCNTSQEAATNPDCRLTLGVEKTEYVQQKGDQDWWVVNVGTVTARSIVHVTAGYRPPAGQDAGGFNTAVNFQINVLDSSNGTLGLSLASQVDMHGSNPPTVLDFTFRYIKSNNDIYLLVQDASGLQSDNLHPYFVKVEVLTDPDVNEPNDTPATATTLTPGGANNPGTKTGFLSTPGDVDYFSIASPNPNSVIWLRVGQDPTFPSPPPHRYRLEYFLYDSAMNPIATDSSSAGSQFSQNLVQIGTARLLRNPGTFYLKVRAYIDPNNSTVIPPGDLNFRYLVEVIIVPLQDPVEIAGNNSIQDALANPLALKTLAVGGSVSYTGRISFVPDPDFYIVRLAGDPSGRPHLLHYKVTPSKAPARFPPVPGPVDRQITVTTPIALGSQSACAAGDAGVCLITANPASTNYSLAVSLCQEPVPQCMQSIRYENTQTPPLFTNLANFESVLQVPPHAGQVDYYFVFQDQGVNWADDTDYQVQFDWWAEPEAAEQVPDPVRTGFTAPASPPNLPAAPLFSGILSYGIGATQTSLGVAPITDISDYDGRGDDVDTYQVDFAALSAADQRLYFAWDIPAPAVDQMPYDLGMRFGFCVPDGGVACPTVQTQTTNGGSQLGLIYTPTPITSWWNTGQIPLEPAYDRNFVGTAPNGDVITNFRDYACGCLESRLINGTTATMFISVFPINRQVWDTRNIPYKISVGYGAYPYAFTTAGGGSQMCPTPCQFTKN